MKKVLLISYYWPPAGGAGVQRPLKFVKYLREFGWEPIVYTCETKDLQVKTDESLLNDIPAGIQILKKKIWEPYNLFFKINKNKAEPNGFKSFQKKTLLSKILLYIRSNLFFPDAKMFWIYPSYWYLKKIIKDQKIDVIISTGPPHTTHIIALKLKKATGVNWIADFRDPWTKIEYFSDLKLTNFIKNQHFKFEKKVLDNANAVVVVGKTMKKEYEEITSNSIHIITNGFDSSDFSNSPSKIKPKFNFSHTGTLRDTQNHDAFWKALAEICEENSDFKSELELNFYGFTDNSVLECAKMYGLENNVNLIEYVSHNEIVKIQQESLILLLIINKLDNPNRIITGKIFEYIASQRPILLLGPLEGDAADILNKVGQKHIADFEDKLTIKKQILDLYSQYKSDTLNHISANSEMYTRRNLTKSLAEILDNFT